MISNDVIFWTQIASIVAFIFSVFSLYRLLVDKKDATIQLLAETVNTLKIQLAEARNSTPDVLAQSLSCRVKMLDAELKRLSQEKHANQKIVYGKEEELRATLQKTEELRNQVSRARELLYDFLCPHCGSTLTSRQYHSEYIEYHGRELDVDHEYSEYECGYSVLDGKPHNPCKADQVRNVSAIIND